MEVSISTAGRSGTLSKTIMVETDHPDHQRVPLKLSANVVVDLDFATTHIRLNDLKVGQKDQQVVAFTAEDPASVKFDKPVVSGDGVTAKIARTGAGADTRWNLTVTFEPTESGPMSGFIDVKLLAPEEKDLKLSFSGMVKGVIEVSPPQVMVRRKTDEDSPVTTVTLKSEKLFKVKSASDPDGFMKVKVTPLENENKVQLELLLTDKATEQPRFGTNIKVTTNLAAQSEFSIPVYVMTNPSAAPH